MTASVSSELARRDGFRVDVDGVVGADAGIDGRSAETFDEFIPERDRLRGQWRARMANSADRLRDGLAADAGEEVSVLALDVDAADRDRHLRVDTIA